MTSSQDDDQNAQGSQNNDFLIAVGKSLNLDDRSSGQNCHVNGYEPSDKGFAHLRVRVHLHHDNELDSPVGIAAAEPPIDVDEIKRRSDNRHVAGRRLVRTVAFGVLTGVVVSAGLAWHFYDDAHSLDNGRAPSALVSMKAPGSNVTVEQASKTSDRVPTQDQAALLTQDQAALPTQDQAAPVLSPGQVSVAPGSSPELQDQLESIASDVAVVRRIVERLAAVQEQMVLDMATLQKSNQNASQKASLLPHPPAGPVPSRPHAPNIVRSTPSAPVPFTLFQTTSAPH